MLGLFTTRESMDYPPAQTKTPEGEHFDKSHLKDVADPSSSGVSTRNISQSPATRQGGAAEKSSVRQSRILPPPPTPPALRGRNGTPPGPRIDVDRKETKAEYIQRKMQDYRAPIKRLEAQIGLSDKSKSLYYSLDRHERREAHRKSSSTSVASKNF